MNKSVLINEILKKINFKIHPGQDVRKDYIYRIKKRLFKLIGNEKKFNPRLQVNSVDEYIDIMSNLNLSKPKMIETNVTRNIKLGSN